ncbi:MAG TPA: PD-(D/E)XK nuclease family protein, partial [Thermoanaerobaculia bacterium]
ASVSTQIDLFGSGKSASAGTSSPARSGRSRLLESLAAVCRSLPLDEKVLVAPSLSTGHEIVERLARSGTAWVNLRVESVRSLAHAIVGRSLVEEGRELLSRVQSLALVEQACAESLTSDSYFGALRGRAGLHRALQSTFDDLRETGMTAESLPADAFGDPRKVADVRSVLRQYESALAAGRFVDRSDVLRRAIEEVRRRPPSSPPIYLVPDGIELSAGEKELLEVLSAGRVQNLETDPPASWTRRSSQARLFHALGEENEIREVLRRLLAEGISIDDAEVLYVDRSVYAPLVYEIAREHGIPCTFSEGINVAYTRPGQAVLGFLRWIARDYETEALRAVLAAGSVDLAPVASPGKTPGSVAAARVLRIAGIGWERQRHLPRIDAYISHLEWEASNRSASAASRGEPEARAARREKRLAEARVVRRFVSRLLELVPEGSGGMVTLSDVARGARLFLAEFARVASELEGTASAAIQKLFAEFETVPTGPMVPGEAAERLAAAVAELAAAPDRSRPGRLHVADYRSGGYSGRAHTFVVGLDAARHPGAGLQDPILLDAERREINRRIDPLGLPIRGSRPEENSVALEACIARLRGQVTLSYSCWDLLEARERFPAPFLLDFHRHAVGNDEADYSSLAKALGQPAGFLAPGDTALEEPEWWMTRLARSGPLEGEAARVVRSEFPWLKDGWRAETERATTKFTVYDGWVKSSDGSLDPRVSGKPMSCSSIEQLAKCPFAYFLERVLGLEAPERLERDPTIWLDPLQAGNLQHEVFRRFFEEITAAGEKPSVARHSIRLAEIAAEEIDSWRERVPPASEIAFAARRDDILATCRSFLQLEEEHCHDVTPRWFEVAFGMPWAGSPPPPGSPDAVEIPLGRGKRFLLRGRIDRIDEAENGRFEVWDYKTGGTWGVEEGQGLRGGRQIQPALYAAAVEALLERCGREGAVSRSGYFFPSAKGRGRRIAEPIDSKELSRVLNTLFDLLREGAFPHASDPDACNYCDFRTVCGDVRRAAGESGRKIGDAANAVLAAYGRLDVE